MNASEPASRQHKIDLGKPQHVLERLEAWVEDNPTASVYWIDTEYEAAQILVAMAAALKVAGDSIEDRTGADKAVLQRFARRYRQAASTGRALQFLREIDGDPENQLELYGVQLRAARILVQ